MKFNWKKLSIAAVATFLTAGVLPVAHAEEKPFENSTVKVGVAGDDEVKVWEYVAEKAAKEGIKIEVTLFNDYVQPNVAVANGSLDLNAFQHIAYLEEWNKENKEDLQPIGFTYVSPMGVYSDKVKDLADLPEGATIAIPNDPTNGGRALLTLELAGVIEVDDKAGILPTVKDITKNDKKFKFEELDAAQVATALKDVDAAVINTNYALDNGLSIKDAVFSDVEKLSEVSESYKNAVVARKDKAKEALYLHVVSLYQSDDVADKISEITKGANIAAWTDKD
ncbi:MetQ/NlpA family ABC transporter substrate-binding protein [Tuanshanicoccus lijuaniae]|uniref:MetQ/NlpA family ABC transporter substrate-binding protein n=1 Tax=Aerococcaceae bacterium zg-1292 TaxID=2774330 RepID=UPI001BD8C617|nr:MetQ/NlpA family ABC transporter substrate-binding protein [Aerococcaceae bacterium zg-BR22]MBS4456932.1 MetQ/NlpA family ABC transporter substrate-binding protein [Aerococcaceae bacterium zg-A91]MBS4458792.1 MetQ/NlpA family ABC transporter substrate-binding protein [Aerococcaceae bacterium zg-BR33]